MQRILALFLSLAFLAGCATDHYSAIHSHRIWPTQTGVYADTSHGIPIYTGWPERPYQVLGVVQFSKSNTAWGLDNTKEAVRICQKKGDDAVIVGTRSELGLDGLVLAGAYLPFSSGSSIAALLIKWKSPAEIAKENNVRQDFLSRMKKNHPKRQLTDEFLKLAFDYGAFVNLDLHSRKDMAKLDDDINLVMDTSTNNAGDAHWLFKGTMHGNGLETSFAETVYGIATESLDGQSLTLDSAQGREQIHFNGQLSGARLSGMMNINSGPGLFCRTHAEGSMVPNRISLDCRGENEVVTVRGSFTFLK